MVRRWAVGSIAAIAALAAVPVATATPPGTNGALAWQRESRTTPPALWIANADGTGARRVFAARGIGTFEPAWSPVSATTLAFSRSAGEPFDPEIYVGDVETGQARPVTDTPAAAIAPAFSPDGSRIAFFSVSPPGEDRPPGPPRIATVAPDGSGLQLLTPDDADSVDPDVSPDGRRIVYTEGRPVGASQFDNRLVVMNADGTGRRALTRFGGRIEINAKWMPDGRRIVFESATRRQLRSDIEVVGADGRGRRKLIATRAFETNPVPSPDGRRIVLTSDRHRRGPVRLSPSFEVYTAAIDGTDVVRITRNRVPDLFPDWQRLP